MSKILNVDLSKKKVTTVDLDKKIEREFLGGLGLGIKFLYDEVGPDVDPLSPSNMIIIAPGKLTGTITPTSDRTEVVTKSPLTGILGIGNFGGLWGPRLKWAGLEAIIVKGRCESPVYLWLQDGKAELRDANYLWGKDCWETTDLLKKELGSDVSVLAIGQAGENLVRFACPVVDYSHAAGRSHAGCVMGSKKLKAIAVRGNGRVSVANPKKFREIVGEVVERVQSYPERGDRLTTGSTYFLRAGAEAGMLPARNYQTGIISSDSDFFNLPEVAANQFVQGPDYGYKCPLARLYGCNLITDIKMGPYAGLKIGGVSFSEPGWVWGAMCGIKNYPAMWKCRELCQRYGMDQVGPLSFAMELFERGIITKEDTDGLDLSWGNETAIMQMLHKIAYRDGFGDTLAEGTTRAAKAIGQGSKKYAMTIKGMVNLYADPRTWPTALSLGTLVCLRGGDDLTNTHACPMTFPDWAKKQGWSKEEYLEWFVERLDMFEDVKIQVYGLPPHLDSLAPGGVKGKAAYVKWYGELAQLFNSLGVCLFAANTCSVIGPTLMAKLYSACTANETSPSEMMKIGERITNLMKAYIVREGLARSDDDFPARFYEEPLPEGPAKGAVLSRDKVNKLLNEYYEMMGWDKKSGIPTKIVLTKLGLGYVADNLSKLGFIRN